MNSDLDTKPQHTPEGQEQSPRANDAAGVACESPNEAEPAGDALPLDGSLSLNDTEPVSQDGLHADSDRILVGSEAGQTAEGAIQNSDAVDEVVDSKGVNSVLTDDSNFRPEPVSDEH